jgi:hypothetical protein
MNGENKMNNGKLMFRLAVALGVLDISCAFMHLCFEATLLSNTSIYREFLLVENLLVGLAFLCLATTIFSVDHERRRFGIQLNSIFWGIFLVIATIFKPETSTLEIVRKWLPLSISQSSILILTGGSAFAIAIALLRLGRTSSRQWTNAPSITTKGRTR